MKVVTEAEIREYLLQFPELRCEGKVVGFDHPEAKGITIDLRLPEPHQLVFLARLAASLMFEGHDFQGACLWVTQWGVWNPYVESVGFNTLERYRQGFGENRPLTTAPGHFFREDELLNSVSCLVQPMLVGWDAYYFPQFAGHRPEFFLVVSHESFLDIQTRTEDAHKKAIKVLTRLNWIRVSLGRVSHP